MLQQLLYDKCLRNEHTKLHFFLKSDPNKVSKEEVQGSLALDKFYDVGPCGKCKLHMCTNHSTKSPHIGETESALCRSRK